MDSTRKHHLFIFLISIFFMGCGSVHQPSYIETMKSKRSEKTANPSPKKSSPARVSTLPAGTPTTVKKSQKIETTATTRKKPSQKTSKKQSVSRKRTKKTAKSTPIASESRIETSLAFIYPVKGKVTQKFGIADNKQSKGIVVSAPLGTPIRAAAAGEIVYSDNRIKAYGNMIIIKHKAGYMTVYSYNQRNVKKVGDTVKQAEIIGYVGDSGDAIEPSLHFEIRRNRTAIDPLAVLK